jgi:hypothetical protein
VFDGALVANEGKLDVVGLLVQASGIRFGLEVFVVNGGRDVVIVAVVADGRGRRGEGRMRRRRIVERGKRGVAGHRVEQGLGGGGGDGEMGTGDSPVVRVNITVSKRDPMRC